MRHVEFAAAAAMLCLGLATTANATGSGCPPSVVGSHSYLTYFVLPPVPIISTAHGLKPQPTALQNGFCIDSANATDYGGNIHLYAAGSAFVEVTFTMDPSLGTFHSNVKKAFTAPGQAFCAPNSEPNPGTLTVCLTSMGHNKHFPYYMRYVDTGGHHHKIEPGIQNH